MFEINIYYSQYYLHQQYEFWTKSSNPESDYKNLQFLYESGFLKPNPKQYCSDGDIFWDSFQQSLQANEKGYNGKRRILSIIAEKFSYRILMNKLNVSVIF